jgi:hypothetical protein
MTLSKKLVFLGVTSSLSMPLLAGSLDSPSGPTESNVGTQNITPGTAAQTITQEYHNGSGSVSGDADLTAENIKKDVEIFGVTGNQVAHTYNAAVAKTGQTTSYAAGDDGDLERGATWPNPRFTDNDNGTVTDNLTGLIWLKDANCFGTKNWTTALSDANNLSAGFCGLTDGSSAGHWRLPNWNELRSLINAEYYNPALSNTAGTAKWSEGNAFSGVQTDNYWSSTTDVGGATGAWCVDLDSGYVSTDGKANTFYVWPVRGGQ